MMVMFEDPDHPLLGAAAPTGAGTLRASVRITHLDDVQMLWAGGARVLVACDSAGAIGGKAHDVVKVPPQVVGRFTARVPIMELLALGVPPAALVAALSVEPEPTGEGLLEGIRQEAAEVGLPPEAILVSTEKNMPTCQTGIGVTAIGLLSGPPAEGRLPYGRAQPGDWVMAVGVPKVGPAVRLGDPEIMDLPAFLHLCRWAFQAQRRAEVLPVGSGGIATEAAKLARRAGLAFRPLPGPLDLAQSAGPSTCALAAVTPAEAAGLQAHMREAGRPCQPVGVLQRPPGADSPGRGGLR